MGEEFRGEFAPKGQMKVKGGGMGGGDGGGGLGDGWEFYGL